jgi:hypothetical protein
LSHLQSVFAIVAVVVLALFGLAWTASSVPPRPAPIQIQHGSQSQEKNGPAHEKGESSKTLWEKTAADPVALFTLGVLIFTAVLAASTIALWCVTRQTVELGRDEFIATLIIRAASEHSLDCNCTQAIAGASVILASTQPKCGSPHNRAREL